MHFVMSDLDGVLLFIILGLVVYIWHGNTMRAIDKDRDRADEEDRRRRNSLK